MTLESSGYKKLSDLYNQSIQANSLLVEEQKRIHKMLMNIDFENVDERSDLISKIKSDNFICPSPSRVQKKATV